MWAKCRTQQHCGGCSVTCRQCWVLQQHGREGARPGTRPPSAAAVLFKARAPASVARRPPRREWSLYHSLPSSTIFYRQAPMPSEHVESMRINVSEEWKFTCLLTDRDAHGTLAMQIDHLKSEEYQPVSVSEWYALGFVLYIDGIFKCVPFTIFYPIVALAVSWFSCSFCFFIPPVTKSAGVGMQPSSSRTKYFRVQIQAHNWMQQFHSFVSRFDAHLLLFFNVLYSSSAVVSVVWTRRIVGPKWSHVIAVFYISSRSM